MGGEKISGERRCDEKKKRKKGEWEKRNG